MDQRFLVVTWGPASHPVGRASVVRFAQPARIIVTLLLQSVREEHFYTWFALMYFELPREKAGEAGWSASKSFSCTFSGL